VKRVLYQLGTGVNLAVFFSVNNNLTSQPQHLIDFFDSNKESIQSFMCYSPEFRSLIQGLNELIIETAANQY